MKKYLISSNFDYEKVCYATLKKVFSVTLFPRVLFNIQNPAFEKNFAKKLDFECFFEQKFKNFAKKVHNFDFDLGIFFFENDKKNYIKLVDGNGKLAGSFVTNIFDNVFSMSKNEFQRFKTKIDYEYSKLDKTKLLVEKFN